MVLFHLLIVSLGVSAELKPESWQAGIAKARITPQESMWLSGYGSRDKPSEGVRTELWAKALALASTNGVRGIVVTLDLVGVDRSLSQSIRTALEKATAVPAQHISLLCSHTHTGPVTGRNLGAMYFFGAEQAAKVSAYEPWLTTQVVAACKEAVAAMSPAKLSYAVGHATFGVNRRNNPEPLVEARRAGGTLAGPVDYEVPVLRISDAEAGIKGIVFGYACHATVLADFQFSGDYPGFAQLELERRFPGIVSMFAAGCGADINPLPRRTPELARRYGALLADATEAALQGVLTPIPPSLRIDARTIDLPFESVPTRGELEERSRSTDKYQAANARWLLAQLAEQKTLPRTYPYPISVWHLGDSLPWICLGGEVTVEYSLKLKAALGRPLWVSSYAHDVMAYIPSQKVWDEGGYEGAAAMVYYGLPSRWARGVESLILGSVQNTVGISQSTPK